MPSCSFNAWVVLIFVQHFEHHHIFDLSPNMQHKFCVLACEHPLLNYCFRHVQHWGASRQLACECSMCTLRWYLCSAWTLHAEKHQKSFKGRTTQQQDTVVQVLNATLWLVRCFNEVEQYTVSFTNTCMLEANALLVNKKDCKS